MKNLIASASVLAVTATGALAGGIDRSGQGIGIIFEDGGYVELSFGMVMPSVTGSVLGGALPSGDMASTYTQFSLGVKQDINDKVSVALILDQPYGANVSYPASAAPYPLSGTTAVLNSQAITAMARYKLSDRMSVHGGLRYETLSGVIEFGPGAAPLPGYTLDAKSSGGVGYSVGAAYEIPEIALRVAVTYNSAITHNLTGPSAFGATDFDSTTPQSVNLDFQSGIAEDTLLFGSIRWVDWPQFDIAPNPLPTPLLDYSSAVTTYNIGVGRKFSDTFSGSISLGYEAAKSGTSTDLAPTNGYFSVQVGGKYTMGDMNISGGVRYVMLGDATTSGAGASFADNSAIGIGIKVGYNF